MFNLIKLATREATDFIKKAERAAGYVLDMTLAEREEIALLEEKNKGYYNDVNAVMNLADARTRITDRINRDRDPEAYAQREKMLAESNVKHEINMERIRSI